MHIIVAIDVIVHYALDWVSNSICAELKSKTDLMRALSPNAKFSFTIAF